MAWYDNLVYKNNGKVYGAGEYSLAELTAEQRAFIAGMQLVTDGIREEMEKRKKEDLTSVLARIEAECAADALAVMKKKAEENIGEAIVSLAQSNGFNHEEQEQEADADFY